MKKLWKHSVALVALVGSLLTFSFATNAAASSNVAPSMYRIISGLNTVSPPPDNDFDWRIATNTAMNLLSGSSQIVVSTTDGGSVSEWDASSGCAIVSDNLWCWGDNTYGRLGDGSTTSSPIPKMVLSGVKDVFTTSAHTCAVTLAGDLVCAGSRLLSSPLVNFSAPLLQNVVAINDSPWPCVATIDERLLCAGNFRAAFSVPISNPVAWTWHDTGLKSSGKFVVSNSPLWSLPTGPSNTWDQPRTICSVHRGLVSCVVMTPNLSSPYVPDFGAPLPAYGISDVTEFEQGINGSLIIAYSNGLLYRASTGMDRGLISNFVPVGPTSGLLGVITAHGCGGCNESFVVTPSGLVKLSTESTSSYYQGEILSTFARFEDSTTSVGHSIAQITSRTNHSLLLPMEVQSSSRIRRGAKITVSSSGQPVVGAQIVWRSTDIAAHPDWTGSAMLPTDSTGSVVVTDLPTGPVTFTVTNGVSQRSYLKIAELYTYVEESGDVILDVPPTPPVVQHQIRVVNTRGEAVPNAVVKLVNLFRSYTRSASDKGAAAWSLTIPTQKYFGTAECNFCFTDPPMIMTGEDGIAEFPVFVTTKTYASATIRSGTDFTVTYDDGLVPKTIDSALKTSPQTVVIDIPLAAGIISKSSINVNKSNPAQIRINSKVKISRIIVEQICNTLVTGGLWSGSMRIGFGNCPRSVVQSASVRMKEMTTNSQVLCSEQHTARTTINVCPVKSMFIRVRALGRASSRVVCLVVAKNPCVATQESYFGVPQILKSGSSISIEQLISKKRGEQVSGVVLQNSQKTCKIVGSRLIGTTKTGKCFVSIARTKDNRVLKVTIPLWVVR